MENHADVRAMLVQLLLGCGYIVRDCSTVDETVQQCTDCEPHVVLLDVAALDEMAGIALAHKLRARMAPRGLLIAMTVDLTTALVAVAFDAIVLKPFPIERIEALIQTWFEPLA